MGWSAPPQLTQAVRRHFVTKEHITRRTKGDLYEAISSLDHSHPHGSRSSRRFCTAFLCLLFPGRHGHRLVFKSAKCSVLVAASCLAHGTAGNRFDRTDLDCQADSLALGLAQFGKWSDNQRMLLSGLVVSFAIADVLIKFLDCTCIIARRMIVRVKQVPWLCDKTGDGFS